MTTHAPTAHPTPSPGRVNALIGLLCLIWGSTWIVIAGGLRDLPPFTSAGARFLFAAFVMTFLARMWSATEAIGTFALVFLGCGAVIVNDLQPGSVTHVGVSLVFGLVVMAMIYSVGETSGAHLNPAVTVGFWLARRLPTALLLPYIGSQLLGATAAAFCLRMLFPAHEGLGATIPAGSIGQSFGLEVLLTCTLMFVILSVSTGSKEKGLMAGIAVGGTVSLAALFGGPISGASMNPARSLGPALAAARFDSLWIYVAAPLVGSVLACLLCRALAMGQPVSEPSIEVKTTE